MTETETERERDTRLHPGRFHFIDFCLTKLHQYLKGEKWRQKKKPQTEDCQAWWLYCIALSLHRVDRSQPDVTNDFQCATQADSFVVTLIIIQSSDRAQIEIISLNNYFFKIIATEAKINHNFMLM